MLYYDNKNKSVGKVSKSDFWPTVYLTVEGEILDKSFKDDYNYKFINTIKEYNNGKTQIYRIVELGSRKSKQQSICFE